MKSDEERKNCKLNQPWLRFQLFLRLCVIFCWVVYHDCFLQPVRTININNVELSQDIPNVNVEPITLYPSISYTWNQIIWHSRVILKIQYSLCISYTPSVNYLLTLGESGLVLSTSTKKFRSIKNSFLVNIVISELTITLIRTLLTAASSEKGINQGQWEQMRALIMQASTNGSMRIPIVSEQ